MVDANNPLTGNRALELEEPLLFEQGQAGRSGVDLPEIGEFTHHLGPATRDSKRIPTPLPRS